MSVSDTLKEYMPDMTDEQVRAFCTYYGMLADWNTRMNLTAITGGREVAEKHFLDSILPEKLIPGGARVIDVGTGAGFPGIPLKIVRPDIKLTLVDSLNKRTEFLKAVCAALDIKAQILHARAEDAAREPLLREKFDIAVSRAVTGTNALIELTVPFLKVNGCSLMYKGPAAAQELTGAENALCVLKSAASIKEYPAAWGTRCVISVQKLSPTPKTYPRKAGTVTKQPL